MKRISLLLLVIAVLLVCAEQVKAFDKNKKSKIATSAVDTTKITWMNWDDVQVAMKKLPRKVWVDVYTDWCSWCKVMDKKTYTNPDVIRYLNTHFYAVKFNAEQRDDIMFMSKTYKFNPQYNASDLAVQLMSSQMTYPTNIFLGENFQAPASIPGYQSVQQIEVFLKYFGGNHYKSQTFEAFKNGFTGSWTEKTN